MDWYYPTGWGRVLDTMEAGHQDPEMLIYLEWSHMLRVFFILFLADLKTGLKTSNAHLIHVH